MSTPVLLRRDEGKKGFCETFICSLSMNVPSCGPQLESNISATWAADISIASTESAQVDSEILQRTSRVIISASGLSEAARHRKSHKKSRSGCLCCKRRRVKCDEARPTCSSCQRRGTPCSYNDKELLEDLPRSDPVDSVARLRIILPSGPRSLDTSDLEISLIQDRLSNKSDLKTLARVAFSTEDLKLFKHFAQITGPTIGGLEVQRVYSTVVPQLAVDHPHLMHAVLAFSFIHVRFLSTKNVNASHSSRNFARYHWQQCLTLYSKKVAPRITGTEADAMLVTSTLINGIAFALVSDTCPKTTWPFSDHTDDLLWLRIQSGINLIFQATFPLDSASRVREIFGDAEDESYLVSDIAYLLTLAPELCRLCEITEASISSTNPYLDALQLLSSIMNIPCNSETIFIHLSFIASARQEYIALLYRKDHNALLILCYWYAILCTYDCWWISIRSKTECVAICLYLEQYGSDSTVSLLDAPARACGVVLKRQREGLDCLSELESQTLMPCTPM